MDTQTIDPSAAVFQAIPIDKIHPSRHQARKDFDEEGIKQLAASIEKEDLLQPITVRKVGEDYELIAGERRLRAVKSLGRTTIEGRVIEVVNEAAACAKGLVENLQRKDLNPVEEAEGFQDLSNLDKDYWTQEEMAQIAGKTQDYISRSLKLLNLPVSILESMRRRILYRSHGIELGRLPNQEMQLEAAKVMENGLKRNDARKLVDEMLKGKNGKKSSRDVIPIQDPLSAVWDRLHSNQRISSYWEARYGVHKPAPGQILNGWFFFAMPVGDNPKEGMAGWFEQMAGAIREGAMADPVSSEAVSEVQEAEQGLMQEMNPSLPKTEQGMSDLQEVAEKGGPKAVYARIYGADSPMTKAVPFETWAEAGMTPADGLRQILDGIKKMQG